MSLKEGKDNLAYRNYKMSDDYKKRLLDNYSKMLNYNFDENNEEVVNREIVNLDGYRKSRDDSLPLKTKKTDWFVKVCVASFAVISTVGVLKVGFDKYSNRTDLSEVAKKSSTKIITDGGDIEDAEDVTEIPEEYSDCEIVGEFDESKFPTLYSDCYDNDGKLKDGYSIKIIKDTINGTNKIHKIVGMDFVEISKAEYDKNCVDGHNKLGAALSEIGAYIYYLQDGKFCRTSCDGFFDTGVYSYVKMEKLEKKDGKVYIYPKDPGSFVYSMDADIPGDEYFCDSNMVTLTKIAFDLASDVKHLYVKEYETNNNVDAVDYDGRNFCFIDNEDSLWYVEDADATEWNGDILGGKKCTYVLKPGKNFKINKMAEHVTFDYDIDFSSDEYDNKKVYVKPLENFKKSDIVKKDDKILYKGIDYK